METKIKKFLQSDLFILSVALLLGLLCHLFVVTEVVPSDKQVINRRPMILDKRIFERMEMIKKENVQSNS